MRLKDQAKDTLAPQDVAHTEQAAAAAAAAAEAKQQQRHWQGLSASGVKETGSGHSGFQVGDTHWQSDSDNEQTEPEEDSDSDSDGDSDDYAGMRQQWGCTVVGCINLAGNSPRRLPGQ